MLSKEELKEQLILNHLIKHDGLNENEAIKLLIQCGLAKEPVFSNVITTSILNLVLKFKERGVRLFDEVNPFILSQDAINFSRGLESDIVNEFGETEGRIFLHPRYYRSELI
jgi:hypothetical protein|tara:strand:+ start:491 stop:826 length:336 start_codon:yes stop_codon:yes gene_type:complete